MKNMTRVLMVCALPLIVATSALAQREQANGTARPDVQAVQAEAHRPSFDGRSFDGGSSDARSSDDRRGVRILDAALRDPADSVYDSVLGRWIAPVFVAGGGAFRAARLDLTFRLRSDASVTAELIGPGGEHIATNVVAVAFAAGDHQVSISLAGLRPGNYFVRLTSPAGIAQQRLTIGR